MDGENIRQVAIHKTEGIAVGVPPLDELAECWPILSPILKRATDRCSGYEPIDLLQAVMLGRMTMFVVRDNGRITAAAVTEIRQFPRCRSLEIAVVAGTGIERWLTRLMDAIEAYADACGCHDLVGYGRKGWVRLDPRARVDGVRLVKRLGE